MLLFVGRMNTYRLHFLSNSELLSFNTCDALRDLVAFVQLKKHEKTLMKEC